MLDSVDKKILACLSENSRMNSSAIGAKVNMSVFAATHPEVMECHVVTGNSDFLLKVCTDTTKSLEKLLDDLKRVKGVSSTRTSIVMSSVKNRVSPVDPGDEKL